MEDLPDQVWVQMIGEGVFLLLLSVLALGLLLYNVFIYIFFNVCVKCGLFKEGKVSSYFFGKSISCTISSSGHWRISEVSLVYTGPYNFNYEIQIRQKVVLQYVLLDRFMFMGRKLFPLVAS